MERQRKYDFCKNLEEFEYPAVRELPLRCSTMQYGGRYERQTRQSGQNFGDINYRFTHKGCDFNNDRRAFIHSYLNKLCALQLLTHCIDACNIIYKRL